MENKTEIKDIKQGALAILVLIGIPVLFFGGIWLSSFSEKTKINKAIAEVYNLEYSDIFELDSRVNFYSFSAAKRGDKNGIFYEVDGEEFEGGNSQINQDVRLYVSSWCE